jgi:FKBP-type peptidyl-prolyl cis-trans isomerase FkpA
MRVFLILFPAILMAQTPPPAAKAAPTAPKAAATKSATPAAKSATPATSAKSAKAKAAAPAAAPGALTTDDQKTIYALGLSMAQQLSQMGITPAEYTLVKQALTDAAAGKPALELSAWQPKFGTFANARSAKMAAAEKVKSKAFLDAASAEPGATRAPSGLVYRELAAGTGASPKATDKVRVNYRGTLTNGTEFDSSYKRNMPAEFPLNGVIPCWTEGVQKMKVGGKSKLVCPSEIAYGDQGRPSIPPGATLVFEIELLAINP